jgi:recombination protein RecT
MSTEPQPEDQAKQKAVASLKEKQNNLSLLLDKFKGSITQALPQHLNADVMIRTVLTAANKTPDILNCTAHSILSAVITAAQLGLRPDSILGECYLIPFNNTKKGVKECQIVIGYRGLCTLAMNTGKVKSVQARAVYAANADTPDGEIGDFFEWELGLNEKLVHRPGSIKDENLITHFYAIVKYTNGGHVMDVMTREQINKIRDESANYKSAKFKDSTIWGKYFAEMGCKTVLRRMMKYVPLSPELTRAVGLDEAGDHGGQKLAVEILTDEATPQEMRDAIDAEIVDEDIHDQNEYTDTIKDKLKQKTADAVGNLESLLKKDKPGAQDPQS